ncbi:MAG: DNA polymerase III subunit delta' [Nitrospirae bacterium]|nr:DNA polymerase III subunit delta' [Nitrospirota bacterium]
MTARAAHPPIHPIIGHERAQQVLMAAVRTQRLAHAYLFTGPDGIGKRLVATRWAMAINCEAPPKTGFGGCGACRACTMALAGNHPDLIVIEPDGLFIKIEQIRAVQAALGLTAWSGSRKIILIDQADRLNQEAANCLLKTLEEPPAASLLILISASPDDLLPTLRSRCHPIRFSPLAPDALTPWLIGEQRWSAEDAALVGAVAGGCIGRALAVDPSTLREERDQIDHWITESCLERTGSDRALSRLTEGAETAALTPEQFERTLRWLLLWLQDAVRLIVSTNQAGALSRFPSAQRAARQLPIAACSDLASQLHWTWRASYRNINRHLLLEQWLIALREAYLGSPHRSRSQEPTAP